MTALAPCELATEILPEICSEAVGLNDTFITAFCPALRVSGVEIPLAAKSLAFTLTCEIVRLVFPLFVIVTLLEPELPTVTPVKLTLAGLAERVTEAAAPVPLSATAFGELGALLEMTTLPDKLPAAVGANSALNVVLCPAASVAGVFRPLMLKPEPLAAICAIVRVAVPVFVTVKLCDFVWPSTTLPKAKLAGVTLRPACAPVPLSAIVKGDPLALLVITTAPVTLPVAAGAKLTLSVVVWEGFRVAGAVSPLTANPAPLGVILEICTAAFPVLVTVTCCVGLLPIATVPKLRLVGLALNCPLGAELPVPLKGIFSVGFVGSLLTMAMLPLAAPAVVGENVTVAWADCPALMVFGVVIPLIPNPFPVNVSMEMVKSAEPRLFKTKLAVPFNPFETVPKSIEVGATDSCG